MAEQAKELMRAALGIVVSTALVVPLVVASCSYSSREHCRRAYLSAQRLAATGEVGTGESAPDRLQFYAGVCQRLGDTKRAAAIYESIGVTDWRTDATD